MKKLILLATAAILLSGCTTIDRALPVGGSKSDGMVELGYEYGAFDKVAIDWGAANDSAIRRCERWGYAAADKFEGEIRTCTASNQYGCVRWLAKVQYQCID